jgi:hypothetical protein
MSRLDQQLREMKIRPKIRLSEIERLVRKHHILTPPLCRSTLVNMCQDGTFETAGGAPHPSLGWLVIEKSFLEWVKSLDG